MKALGIDIGASGIKGAPVSLKRGVLLADRHRVATPDPATPHAIAEAVAEIIDQFEWKGAVGCGFPAVIKNGVIQTAANLDGSWVGTDASALFEAKTECRFIVLNDADAAGVAEMQFGAGKGQKGVVVMLTFGSGIGSAIFSGGKLVPNSELGQLRVRGRAGGEWASDKAREEKDLTWKQWAKRVNRYLEELDRVLLPDLIILGGGASKKHEKFLPLLRSRCPVVPAQMLNEAGIVGAAVAAKRLRS